MLGLTLTDAIEARIVEIYFCDLLKSRLLFVSTAKMSGDEPLSKNELKRRQKAEKKAAEKAEKEALKAQQEPAKAKAGNNAQNKVNEEEISPNEYFKLRSSAVEALKAEGETHPYPHKFHVDISLTDFIAK